MMNKRVLFRFIISIIMVFTLIPQFSFATESTSGQITGFAPLEIENYYYEGDPMEEDITAKLPDTIEVYFNGSDQTTSIDVSWQSVESFDETDFYFYSMKPVWGDSYTLSPQLSEIIDVPWINVYKQEPLSDMTEPMMTEDEIPPIYVNEEEAEVEYGEVDGAANESDDNAVQEKDPVEEENTDEESDDVALKVFKWLGEESYAASNTNTDKVYNYLTGTMGLNKAAACGVMTNINAESAMNPINLENTYNTLYGLTDTEYTKRVDAGKGAYKTKSGKSRNFKTDYCGYGICQWTSLGRRANLLSKALSKKTSVGDINMQLEFLNEELTGSYSSVMNTLRSVPNNAQGAYMAAFVFCMNFEVPANTLNTSASRAKTCISSGGYWQKYSGSASSVSGKSFLSLTGYAYPKTLKSGKGMTVKGYAISNYNIKSVSANIKDANGVKKYSVISSPGSTVFSLAKFDDDLLFSKLATGTYTYNIKATDKFGKTVKASHTFTVKSSGSNSTAIGFSMDNTTTTQEPSAQETTEPKPDPESTMSIYSFNYPKTLKKGKAFTIKGKCKSNYALRKVTVKVTTTGGTTKLSASKTLTGTAKTYNIYNLDSKVKFGKLARGKYKYKVICKDKKTTKTLLNKTFTVK